jgi:hypothetical protein
MYEMEVNMKNVPTVFALIDRYPSFSVDGYAIYCAAEDLAKFMNCSVRAVLSGALESSQAAKLLLGLAENYMGPVD